MFVCVFQTQGGWCSLWKATVPRVVMGVGSSQLRMLPVTKHSLVTVLTCLCLLQTLTEATVLPLCGECPLTYKYFKSQLYYKDIQKKQCFRTGFRQMRAQHGALCSADSYANGKQSHVNKYISPSVFARKYKLILNSLYREQKQVRLLLKPHTVRWGCVCNLFFRGGWVLRQAVL